MKDEHKYDDIIHLPHPVSKRHPQMSILDRAAQFSPFAALTGHEEAIKETERFTEEKIELDESRKELLDERLQIIRENLEIEPVITFTYFKPDMTKSGGAYDTSTGRVKKINEYEHKIYLEEGQMIAIDDIVEIQGELFKKVEEYGV